ncbi:MAG TPA: NIL domain-containing protein [Mycobacteriales bacterium]|nr:NIL domain-containing protein [Mycobacteriales bacterium]
MATARWHLTYSEELVSEPLLWELATQHGLVTNVRRANVEDTLGWVIVEVHGEPAALREGREFLTARGVQVAELGGDVVAG